MGQVFLGRSPGGRPVAVKVIRAELLAGHPDFRARFAREVAAARRVSALFTAPVVDADPDGDMPWLVTAYVPGPSLADAVSDHGPMGADVVRALAAGLAEGLAAVHAVGVVHRDLKPSNVLLASDGPRIIDFGISRAAEAGALTGTGMLVGSPAFMSPEQADGREAGPPSDVFSLGSVLTFAATGQGPFRAGLIPALLFQVVNAEPAIADVPPGLRPLVGRCLAKDPQERPTPAQIIAELGPTGLLQDWLPRAVAETLPRYDPPAFSRESPPSATAPPPRDAYRAPLHPPTSPAATAPAATPGSYRTPQPLGPAQPRYPPPQLPPASLQPYPSVSSRRGAMPVYPPPYKHARRRPSGALPREYRYGWLSLPVLLFLGVAAFVVPLETYFCLTWGFVLTLVVTRPAAAVIWVRRHGARGIAGRAIRHLAADIAGAFGLAVLAFGALFLAVDVLLPELGPGRPQDYRRAFNVQGPADPFSSLRQAWYFLHLFLPLSVLAVAMVVLLRTGGNLERPLVLPRVAKLLNRQARTVRLLVAGVLAALTVGLVGLNGGLSPAKAPSGTICVVGPKTCAAAAKLEAAHRHRAAHGGR
jgi:serine/threonine protein kinase